MRSAETMEKKILFVASECTPFVKTGGLADVIGSLPQALNQLPTIETNVILPYYEPVMKPWMNKLEELFTIPIEVGWRKHSFTLYQLVHKNVRYYFIKNHYYFSRDEIYGYEDDGERFIFFSQAVSEALTWIDFKPDIVHAHDWQTGLVMAFLKILYPKSDYNTVFTIHNLKYQGVVLKKDFPDLFQISREHIGGMEWNGHINCMKAGIFHADKITTVSPTYAEEIKTAYFGEGLAPLLKGRQRDLYGILNGIDINEYNPAKDPLLYRNYTNERERKKENKIFLQKKLGLPENGNVPMYILISRLVEQKGLHLLQAIIDEFLQEDVQFVLLGTGDYLFEDFFYHAAERNKDKMVCFLGFEEKLAREMYAASDFFVMPSKFEPCGLTQMIALHYKVVPIVRETGGLQDSVLPFNEYTLEGTGFSFANYNAHDLLHVLRYSLSVYEDEHKWNSLLRNVETCDFSWEASAKKYDALYDEIMILEGI